MRVNAFDPVKLAAGQGQLDEFNPLLAKPSELIGFGPVVASDGVPATGA